MTVLIIIILHAVPVYLIGVLTNNKTALIIAAFIAGLIGIIIGNPAYMLGDLLGVAIAYFLGTSTINEKKQIISSKIEEPIQPKTEESLLYIKKNQDSSWIKGAILVTIAIGTLKYFNSLDRPNSTQLSPPEQLSSPELSREWIPIGSNSTASIFIDVNSVKK